MWRICATVSAGLLACGLPLWPIPYHQVDLPGNPSFTLWFAGGVAAGLLGGFLLRRGLLAPALCVAAGFVLAVMARVAVETSRDPTTHNLWPFEVVMAGGIGLASGWVGVALARLTQWVASSRRS